MRGSAALRMTVAPGGALAGPWVKNELWRRARAVPSLDLRFADSKSLVDAVSGQSLITFTRASDATFVNSQGVLTTASSNVPRFDHNPTTGESLGLLIGEQRTNSIRNNTMVGAVAGTPGTLPTNWVIGGSGIGTLTQQVVGTGTVGSLSYVDIRFSGTTSTTNFRINFEPNTQTAAASGQSWTASAYTAVVAGSMSNVTSVVLGVTERTSLGAFLDESSSSVNTSAILLRGTQSRTFNQATTAFCNSFIAFNFASGVAIDITLRIGMPQLEQGAFATSVIPTTGTAATRSADVASITTQGAALRSLFAQFRSPASGTRPIVALDDNTANERIELFTSGTDPKLLVVDGGVTQADIDAGAVTANTLARLAGRFTTNDFAASVSGGASVLDASGTMPTVDRIRIGRDQAGNYLNGHIARITGWDTALPMLPPITG